MLVLQGKLQNYGINTRKCKTENNKTKTPKTDEKLPKPLNKKIQHFIDV